MEEFSSLLSSISINISSKRITVVMVVIVVVIVVCQWPMRNMKNDEMTTVKPDGRKKKKEKMRKTKLTLKMMKD